MRGMRALRNFKPDRCYHLISRIANWAFYLTDEEKSQKVRQREFDRFAQSLPERVPRLLEKGSDKVVFDLLRLLADGPRRPAELRAALGISSVNFFTARYLTPLAKAGYIAAVDTENLHSSQRKYRLAAKGRRLVS